MNVCLECLPCLGKNAVDAAKRSTSDPVLQKKILADSFRMLAENDYQMPPSCTARKILDIALAYTGAEDIFEQEKQRSNCFAEQLLSGLSEIEAYHEADFESRLRLAVAGNILDFGIYADLDIRQAMEHVKSLFSVPLPADEIKLLRQKMDSAKRIFYILDNCGEAVFDRVFMTPYKDKITLGVRGRAVFNDVTRNDLAGCGLQDWKYVENGSAGIPGTVLSECSEEFQKTYEEADLVIAKGQGNFETMNEYSKPIVFLFLAKCPVVTRLLGCGINSVQILLSNVK